MNWRIFFNGLMKAALFAAFYVAGVLTNSQVSQYVISTQQDRINSLEQETAVQRRQIDDLNRRAAEHSENLKTLSVIQAEVVQIKAEISKLRSLHE